MVFIGIAIIQSQQMPQNFHHQIIYNRINTNLMKTCILVWLEMDCTGVPYYYRDFTVQKCSECTDTVCGLWTARRVL